MSTQDLTYFAHAWADSNRKIGIAQADRRYHCLATGRTGTGKSSLLLNKLVQDIKAGRGVGLIDPHGDLAEAVLPFIPKARRKHLVYISPTDLDYPVALNLLGQAGDDERHLIAENLLAIFQKIWQDSWGPRMAYLLRNTLLALLENPGSTLLAIPKLLTDDKYRERMVRNLTDPFVRHYWQKEFAAFPERMRAEVISPVQNKIGAYLTNRLLRNILGQSASTIHFRNIIDQGNILIVNLAKGRLGEEAANLLGSFIVSGLQQAAMARASLPEDHRRDFLLYIDEFQNMIMQTAQLARANC